MIMEAIFRGEFSQETLTYPSTPEFRELNKRIGVVSVQIKNLLGAENAILMDNLLNDIYAAQYIEAESCFKAGLAAGTELQREMNQELNAILK